MKSADVHLCNLKRQKISNKPHSFIIIAVIVYCALKRIVSARVHCHLRGDRE